MNIPMGPPGEPFPDLPDLVCAMAVQYQLDIKILGNILLDQFGKVREFPGPMPDVHRIVGEISGQEMPWETTPSRPMPLGFMFGGMNEKTCGNKVKN